MAEIAGLVLGVLPLISSAVTHYHSILDPARRYLKFSSKVQRLNAQLGVERAIFMTECQILLGTVAGRDLAIAMLGDRAHPSWDDEALCESLHRKIGLFGPTYEFLISSIEQTLSELRKICDELNHIASMTAEDERLGDTNWRHRVGKKLRFSFSEIGLQKTMSSLRRLNKSLVTLSSQVSRLDARTSENSPNLEHNHNPQLSFQAVQQARIIQMASQQLHQTLTQACIAHSEHGVQLCLDAACIDSQYSDSSSHVNFHLAIDGNLSRDDRPPSMLTENSVGAGTESNAASEDASFEKAQPYAAKASGIKAHKPIWLEVESISEPRHNRIADYARQMGLSPMDNSRLCSQASGYLEIYKTKDFCTHLSSWSMDPTCEHSNNCVGILGQSPTYQHVLHWPTTLWKQPGQESISLCKLLEGMTVSLKGQVPQFHRLQLAKFLALTVLQFHSTPWLPASLSSDQIYLSVASGPGTQGQWLSSSPFIKVSVSEGQTSYTTPVDRNTLPSSASADIIPNELLFRLGIMLLELAYCKPFSHLCTEDYIQKFPGSDSISEFVSARRLADDVGTHLGVGFASIVRKCLRCDFGCGEDLEDPLLQERLYHDVVFQLENLEEGFRKLQCAS